MRHVNLTVTCINSHFSSVQFVRMDRLTDFFHHVSHEEHLALSFRPRERSPAKEVTKRPIGRPRKRPLDSASTDPQPCTETN